MKKRCKFYAVIKGYKRGILDDWAECKSYVDGYGGNQYKGFLYLNDALDYINKNLTGEDGSYIYKLDGVRQEFQDVRTFLSFLQEKVNRIDHETDIV